MGLKIAILLLIFFSGPANAQYFKYSDIASAPPNDQNMYVSGVADALARGVKINTCLGSSLKMKAGQLTTNVMSFAASRPALHSKSMADVVAAYLREACPQ
ncbi:MAG: hypothetical protein WAV72_14060, partial [Bradyrhizobium sp.]